MDIELRKLYNDLLHTLNQSNACLEGKRITLLLLSKECELQANSKISQDLQTITEKGELDNEPN